MLLTIMIGIAGWLFGLLTGWIFFFIFQNQRIGYIVLNILSDEPCPPDELAKILHRDGMGLVILNKGSLHSLFGAMSKRGWIQYDGSKYSITRKGVRILKTERQKIK